MDIRRQQKHFILNAPLPKVMWKLSLPAMIAMVLHGLNAFMDTIYIGQLLNEKALSGVALAYPLTAVLLGLGSWVGTGAGNKISILLGKNDMNTAQKVLPNANLLTILSTIVFAIPTYFFAESLIKMMGGSGEILTYGVRYFRITLLAAPLWIYALQLNFIIRSEGKMKTAAIMMAYGLIINIILTPYFILFFEMDVDGAAWATNIAMFIYCLVGFIYFKNGRASFPTKIITISYDKEVFMSIVKLGFPGLIISFTNLVQAIVVLNAIVKVGTVADLAFFAAAVRIQMLLMTPLFGLMRALQPVLGVNYGAKQFDRVKDSLVLFCKTGFWIVFPITVMIMLFPEISIRMVLPEANIATSEIINFRVFMAVIPVLPFVFMSLTYLPAIEQPKYASIIGLARQLVFYVPAMLLLPQWFGLSGVYFGATIIDVILAIWILIIVLKTFKEFENETYRSF